MYMEAFKCLKYDMSCMSSNKDGICDYNIIEHKV